MNTITVDDRELIVTLMLGILQKLDPGGSHFGSCDAQEALRQATQFPPDVAFLDTGSMRWMRLSWTQADICLSR